LRGSWVGAPDGLGGTEPLSDCPEAGSGWAARPKGDEVERATQVPELDGEQKIEIVLAGLRGNRTVKDVCREHEISDTLFYSWRDKLLEGGREALAGKEERSGERELRRRIRALERALGRKTYRVRDRGGALRGWE
jgi:transposase